MLPSAYIHGDHPDPVEVFAAVAALLFLSSINRLNFEMHPALLIPELITIIAHMSQRSDACRMARTCRAWHPVALDRVWQQNDFVDSINVLLNTLPTDVYQPYKSWHRGKPHGGSRPRWLRAPTPAEYEHLYQFSSRIRSLTEPGFIELLQMTMEHPPPRALFPRLATFTLDGGDSTIPPHILLLPFSSPVLSELDLHLTEHNQKMVIDLDAIYRACAPSLSIHVDVVALSVIPRFTEGRRDLVHKLTIKNVDAQGWLFMAALPNLQKLHIEGPTSKPTFARIYTVDKPFRALQALHVSSMMDSRPFVADLLQCCGRLSLETLSLEVTQDDAFRRRNPTTNWDDLFRALEGHCAHDSLRTLKLEDKGEMRGIDDDTLKLLAPFSELRTLWIENKNGVVVHERFIGRLMSSWPRLVSLRLAPSVCTAAAEDRAFGDEFGGVVDHYNSARWISTCTIPGLLEFARLGTSLKSLALSVDFEQDLPRYVNWTRNTKITELDLWNSDMTFPCNVADVILRVFPEAAAEVGVSVVDGQWWDPFPQESRDGALALKWEQVRMIIRMVHRGERRGEHRAKQGLSKVNAGTDEVH
ncbi:hypothetical protein EV715DRAFT_272153 [Schizophyllum commune]